MGTRNARVDAYIAKSAEFARPILEHLREVVHAACPEVEEVMKWSFPNFEYKGLLCNMAAFKAHCAFGFWKNELVVGDGAAGEKAMGQFGKITKLSDLPSKKVLTGYIKKAMKLNDDGVKSPNRSKPKAAPKPVVVPDDLAAALRADDKARATFEKFPPSHQREYIEWITEAKTQATRTRRLETAVQWMAEGKPRNWKYMDC
jgi:uncharacterized protein YdeI (YjbR/CyaY-like superfamily)